MSLKGKTIKSKASGITGTITGVDKGKLKITFTKFQDIVVPLNKADSLLEMDDETLKELQEEIRKQKKRHELDNKESKVETYIDNFEEEEEEIDDEQPPVQMEFDDIE